MFEISPLWILAIGVITVLGLIIALRVNAFIALITAAVVVSLLAPGDPAIKIRRVAQAFGSTAGNIGIVIALAAVIGKCMLDSGAADRVVRAFLKLLGEKRAPFALMGSGFVLSVPVFFDTVFYLLVPLARSMHRRTGKQYLKYILAIAAGGAITHTLVPPTPGPLMIASNLGVDLGMMILVGAIVALPAALVGVFMADLADRRMNVPMRKIRGQEEPDPLADEQLPSLVMSLLPVMLPVILITVNTVLTTAADSEHAALFKPGDIADWPALRDRIDQQAAADEPSPGGRIVELLPEEAREIMTGEEPLGEEQRQSLREAMNDIMGAKQFHQRDAFRGVELSDTALTLLSGNRQRMKKVDTERMNRLLLEAAYNTPEHAMIAPHVWLTARRRAAGIGALFGDANLALLLSTVIALTVLLRQRGLSLRELADVAEVSLMSGGVIILITSAGGAFGAMLSVAQIGEEVQSLVTENYTEGGGGLVFLLLGFGIASVLKVAQGSGTVAMIVGSSMIAAMAPLESLGYHPVYLATAIGAGSLVGSWMNDSGFWIFAKMGGLTEVETLKSWTIMLIVLGITSFIVTLILSQAMPLV